MSLATSTDNKDYKISIRTKTVVEGFHKWPDAPPPHEYLGQRHRHMFYIYCEKVVSHSDRDIEFIQLARQVKECLVETYGTEEVKTGFSLTSEPCEFGNLSCEAIALGLLHAFKLNACEVYEDDENGSRVEKEIGYVPA